MEGGWQGTEGIHRFDSVNILGQMSGPYASALA